MVTFGRISKILGIPKSIHYTKIETNTNWQTRQMLKVRLLLLKAFHNFCQ
jgi:hypothetical protein